MVLAANSIEPVISASVCGPCGVEITHHGLGTEAEYMIDATSQDNCTRCWSLFSLSGYILIVVCVL